MAKQRKKYTGPRLPKNPESKKRYRVYYYRLADTDEYAVQQDTSGSTDSIAQAFRLAAGHCAAAEKLKGEYAKAIVIDAWVGRFIRVYTLKDGEMIRIKEY
jgi:hypothetical protein